MATMKKFEVGKRYAMRSICDHDCVWMYEVVSRTAGTVVLRQVKRDGTLYDDEARFRISKKLTDMRKAETVKPTGSYSMAPMLGADNEVPASIKEHRQFKEKYPDAVLLFRKADYYEAFYEDALTCNNTFGVELDDIWGVAHIKFEARQLDVYLPKLVRRGHRIAIVDDI